ncbi:hypothetical protein GUJ93_ZPchr0006g45379 [Zizania palustris]|uniref:SWIM-type domain-containing protein n=1 Tax=Zizania palustris TaxID=103762 RepID=A0A8J5SLH5_ZIZPA|nr:hypothetical protein GUJ93_ZPchr0006g45379 [Zizania palustris]KAG8075419.1 hypothetical protein GUJ93_ZPchr0006g45379 [Zizania palustris]
MASKGWVADRLTEWLKNNPSKGAKEAKEKLQSEYGIKLGYSKAWRGMKLAMEKIHGTYEESFQELFNWKEQMDICQPGSVIDIEVEKIGEDICFKRIFVALRPCIDGFLAGCRPYLGVDAASLKGKYTGQLASATGVDGHNWLYHVAFGVFHSETEDNWCWFMKNLRSAIGCPDGLVISTDACKGLETAVSKVFPTAEHRECMRHLYGNFIKHFQGDVFTQHLYPAARSYTQSQFRWHLGKIYEHCPNAIEYLETNHSRIWYRCAFSELSKCDYLTNNVSESFNSQVKNLRGLLVHELIDGIRELIMEKRYLRRHVAQGMESGILPNVLKELNQVSNNLRVVKVARSSDDCAEISLVDETNSTTRHSVDIKEHTCSCRVWQLTGKPCKHALAWICSNRGLEIASFVHEYYSVAKFRAAYEGAVLPMPDRSQWPQCVGFGFKVCPPLQKRAAGRPKVTRIRGVLENANKRKVRCSRCKGFGHFAKTCKLAEPPRKRKRDEVAGDGGASTSAAPAGPPQQKKRTPQKKLASKKKRPQAAGGEVAVRSLRSWLDL